MGNCLINCPLSQGDPATVNQLDLRDIQIQENPPMTARYFAFQYIDTNQTQVVLYWYETATFNTNSTAQTQSVMISLITYPSDPQTFSDAEAQELPVANTINNYWTPIQTWSTIALNISQNGLALSAGAAAILVLLIVYAAFLNRKDKQGLLNLYKKLPTQDQLLIKAVTNTQKTNNSTTQAITAEFQKSNTKPTPETFVTEKLAEAEKAGLIKKTLKNRDDKPYFFWENQIPTNPRFVSKLRSLFSL